ncbi:MAG: hypothetical protein WCJ30_02810 [Deltaproteobacteria bacterium]
MIATQKTPSPALLLDLRAPELALLGALEHLLEAACSAIEAANPELLVEHSDVHMIVECLPRLWAAEDIRAHANTLGEAISRYRHAICLADVVPPPDAPF